MPQRNVLAILLSFAFFFRGLRANAYRVAFFSIIVFVYGFYTLVATKMPSYCLVVAPLIFLSLGTMVDAVLRWGLRRAGGKARIHAAITILFVSVLSFLFLDMPRIRHFHTDLAPPGAHDRRLKLRERQVIEFIEREGPSTNFVIFNMRRASHVPLMYHTNHIAYREIPDAEQIAEVRKRGYEVAVVNWGARLPPRITDDPDVAIIDVSHLTR